MRAIEAGVCLPGQFVVDIHGALLEANEALTVADLPRQQIRCPLRKIESVSVTNPRKLCENRRGRVTTVRWSSG